VGIHTQSGARARRRATAASLLIGLLMLTLPTAAMAQPPEMPSGEMSAEDRAAIDAVAQTMLESEDGIPAVYIGIWDPERGAYVQAYGVADREAGRPASVEDAFRIGSISKTFTAAIILQLIDEGLLALADTVADADPDLADRFPALADLTIEQLLSMQSGIPDYMNVVDGAVGPTVEDPTTVWDADELIAFGVAGDIQPAGTGGYSTTNYIALQEIAETLTGQPLADLIETRLTEPLGMPATVLPPNDDTSCISEIEESGGSVPVWTDTTTWNASYGQGGGGMYSTVADLGRWAASLSGTSTLSDDLAAQRLEPRYVLDIIDSYGLGIIKTGPIFGHSGEALGWEGWAAHDPDTGFSLVVFTNTCGDSGAILPAIIQLYAPLGEYVSSLSDAS